MFKFVDFITLSGRLIGQITAKNDMISIVLPENGSKQWYVCHSQKTKNVTEDHDHGTFLDSLFRRLILNKFAWTGDGGTLCIPANSNARL